MDRIEVSERSVDSIDFQRFWGIIGGYFNEISDTE
jgi:hypothetical protein